jgi:hypothetical protein
MVVDTLSKIRWGGRPLVADNPAAKAVVRLESCKQMPDHGHSTAPNAGAKRKKAPLHCLLQSKNAATPLSLWITAFG